MSNTFGILLRLTTFGESHGPAVGGVIDGFPADIEIDLDFIQKEIDKRKTAISQIYTQRSESDKIEIISGIYKNKTLGTPIAFIFKNEDTKSNDYLDLEDKFRPGHADFTYFHKYHNYDYRGGGRASARDTVNWVTAGAFAKIFLKKFNISVHAFTSQIGEIIFDKNITEIDLSKTYYLPTRCPDEKIDQQMQNLILTYKENSDSIGGCVSCIIKNLPIGLGEPVFDKFHAQLAKAILSINGCKGIEFGKGFQSANMVGSQFNDIFILSNEKIIKKTNNSGGTLGGITDGSDVYFRAVFKPTSSIGKKQQTIDKNYNPTELKIQGRHDPCIVPRAVAVVEAMAAFVVADFLLIDNAYKFIKFES